MRLALVLSIAAFTSRLHPSVSFHAKQSTDSSTRTTVVLSESASIIRTLLVDLEDKTRKRAVAASEVARLALLRELTGRYKAVQAQEVSTAASALGIQPPFDRIEVERLAVSISADVILDGTIEFIRERRQHERNTIQTGIRLRARVPGTAEYVGGAAQISSVEVSSTESREALTRKSVDYACIQAVRQLNWHYFGPFLVEAVSDLTSSRDFRVNRGRYSGIEKGTSGIIMRRDKVAGRFRIVESGRSFSTFETNSLRYSPQTGDRIWFNMPELRIYDKVIIEYMTK